MATRTETDSLGEVRVDQQALWGAQTQRALDVFGQYGGPMPPMIIRAVTMIKAAAARANADLGEIEPDVAEAIGQACSEILSGQHNDQFPLSWLQSGSGTNSNMNVNEVIANRASEIMGGKRGEKKPVHPNDHVNRGQSSNDVMPTALHLALLGETKLQLLPAFEQLQKSLAEKGRQFDDIVKTGRTHLMDAAPVRLGQVFGGWAARIDNARQSLAAAMDDLRDLPLGGTAVGTGLNAHPDFAEKTIDILAGEIGEPLFESENHFETQAASDRLVRFSGQLKAAAVALSSIADNIRWLASGPTAGLAELKLPTLMPGSSIMPGKVNPVASEVAVLASARVVANDAAANLGGLAARFELNTMMPLLAVSLLESVQILSGAARLLAESCVDGIMANTDRIAELINRNPMLVTALAPEIGYDAAAKIAKKAMAEGKTIAEAAKEQTDLGERLDDLLDPRKMTSNKPE